MSFDKIKEFIVKNKEFFIFYIILVTGIFTLSGILYSITNILSYNNQCKTELALCASLLETSSKQDDRMEKLMKNLENNMEKADKVYNDVMNSLK